MLLEAIVALALLATGGAAVAALAVQALDAERRAQVDDTAMRAASAFLDAVALWSRGDLDRHLGDRREGPWWLRVERPYPVVYVVVLSDSSRRRQLLRTALYRPAPPDDVR